MCISGDRPGPSGGIDFTPPYVVIEGVYVVPKDSPLQTVADVDRDGIRVAVAQGSAYDLFLTRALKNATSCARRAGRKRSTIPARAS